MMDIYVRAKAEAGYVATIFHRMLCDHGGLETAKRLINDSTVSSGYAALWERGRLDLTVEAIVADNEKWHSLFSDEELRKVRKRLIDYRYFTS
jgi:hypothetical protein